MLEEVADNFLALFAYPGDVVGVHHHAATLAPSPSVDHLRPAESWDLSRGLARGARFVHSMGIRRMGKRETLRAPVLSFSLLTFPVSSLPPIVCTFCAPSRRGGQKVGAGAVALRPPLRTAQLL